MIENNKELGKIKRELWKKAHDALNFIYGDMTDVRILNRFHSEKMLFENTDYIIMWDLVAELRLRAKEMDCLTELSGTDTSTLTSFLLSATETNPLELHFLCPVCKKIEFINERALPWDLPDKPCECGSMMRADGFDIPYEMCISRKFGPWPHLSVDTAFMESAEKIIREKMGCSYRICKLTKPDFAILKFVFLPFSDEPDFEENVDTVDDKYDSYPQITIMTSATLGEAKKLSLATGIDFDEVEAEISDRYLSDSRIMNAFAKADTDGIPGFYGWRHPRVSELKDQLLAAKPKNRYDLLKYLGTMQGTSNWWDNAERLVKDGICLIGDIPSHRDDVFMLLRDKLREAGHTDVGIAHNIATKIRLGVYARVGIGAEDRALIEYLDLPEWFIPYVEKINYMTSKSNSVANLRTALAFMWYKINYPEEFEMCVESRLKMSKEISKKAKSVILGHAIADALGVPAEFRDRETLLMNPITDMIGYGTYNVPRGTWSDDTSMSLAALDSLASGEIDYDDIMQNFVKWCFEDKYTANNEAFDIGRTCFNAISLYKDSTVKNPLACGMSDEYSNGNGSLMRINPFVLYLYYKNMDISEKLEVIHNASSLTHAHERSKIACGIYSFVLWELLGAPYKDYIQKGLRKAKEYYRDSIELSKYHRLFNGIEDLTIDEIKSSGYVVDALEAAIWCLLTTKDYKECVLRAVNLGGDTDTIAAIAGGLAGALYGYDSIPKEWMNILLRRDYIEEMCDTAAQCWSK